MAKSFDVEIEIVEQRGHCPNGHKVGERFLAGRGSGGVTRCPIQIKK